VILSLRQVSLRYGMNTSHINELTDIGVLTIVTGCTPKRPKYDMAQVNALRSGEHYVVCHACGQWAGQITTKHLNVCSGMTVGAYKAQWTNEPLLCNAVSKNKAKTASQRQHQSDTLKARFRTPEGERTRTQIAHASARMHQGDAGARSRSALIHLNHTKIRRDATSEHTKAMWLSGTLRDKVLQWHRDNRETSLRSASHARTYIRDRTMVAARAALSRTSKMHLRFKQRMNAAGLTGFVTEGMVGPFAVDEASYELRLAVEVDGCYWHGCAVCGFRGVSRTLNNDKSKDAYLKASGWFVLRIPGHQILDNADAAINSVRAVTHQLQQGKRT